MALPPLLKACECCEVTFGAKAERAGARGRSVSAGGDDFRIRASVKSRFDWPREPSLVHHSRVETFYSLTKEGRDVALWIITPVAKTFSSGARPVSSAAGSGLRRRDRGGIHRSGVCRGIGLALRDVIADGLWPRNRPPMAGRLLSCSGFFRILPPEPRKPNSEMPLPPQSPS
jgi:hypothetical protein